MNFTQMENFRLSFSSGSCTPCLVFQAEVVLRVYSLHPRQSLFLYSLFLSLCRFSFLVNGQIYVPFHLNPILCVKITQNVLLISIIYAQKNSQLRKRTKPKLHLTRKKVCCGKAFELARKHSDVIREIIE